MSRTYRRKKDSWAVKNYEYVVVPGTYSWIKEYLSYDDERYKKSVIEFHKDKDRYFNSVPGWFVNLYCERSLRRKSNRAVKKWMNNCETDLLLPKYVKDAGWKYY